MKKEIFYCDRCGRELENNRDNRGFHIHRRYFVSKVLTGECLDLCQECYNELGDWMKRGKDKHVS